MIVKVLTECGYDESLLGLSLSFYDHQHLIEDWWTEDKIKKAKKRALALALRGGGHNKFISSIFVWMYIQAPRCWWSEYDTYKVATTANSSSTMHTLDKRQVESSDFEADTSLESIEAFNKCLLSYKDSMCEKYKDISFLKMNLPEGWLQERQVCINYMTLQNIVSQRKGHRLKYWDVFIDAVLLQIAHPELIVEGTASRNNEII